MFAQASGLRSCGKVQVLLLRAKISAVCVCVRAQTVPKGLFVRQVCHAFSLFHFDPAGRRLEYSREVSSQQQRFCARSANVPAWCTRRELVKPVAVLLTFLSHVTSNCNLNFAVSSTSCTEEHVVLPWLNQNTCRDYNGDYTQRLHI